MSTSTNPLFLLPACQGDAFAPGCPDGGRMCTNYWINHLYYRLVMALPTGALVNLLTRRFAPIINLPNPPSFPRPSSPPFLTATTFSTPTRTGMSVGVTLLVWISLLVGWGCYFELVLLQRLPSTALPPNLTPRPSAF